MSQRPALLVSPAFQFSGVARGKVCPGWRRIGVGIQPDHLVQFGWLACLKALHPALLALLSELYLVGRKDHTVKAAGHAVDLTAEHEHIGTIGRQADLQQGLHSACGIEPTGLDQIAIAASVDTGTGLAMQEAAAAASVHA